MKIKEIMAEPSPRRDPGDDFYTTVVSFITQQVPEASEIWLHGSRATNAANRNSDWDFIVIVPDAMPAERYIELALAQSRIHTVGRIKGRPVDIQVARQSGIDEPGSVAYWAVREGQRLWSATD